MRQFLAFTMLVLAMAGSAGCQTGGETVVVKPSLAQLPTCMSTRARSNGYSCHPQR
jgi:hypothetical protein